MSSIDTPAGDAVALTAIGFDERVEALFASVASDIPPGCIPGRVARVDRGAATILLDGATARAELKPTLRHLAEA
ncbi:MAG: hypothetical protein WD800_05455, partial [Dehalococcoidia bacterium]